MVTQQTLSLSLDPGSVQLQRSNNTHRHPKLLVQVSRAHLSIVQSLDSSTLLQNPQWRQRMYLLPKNSLLRSQEAGHQTPRQISGSCTTMMFTISKLEVKSQSAAIHASRPWSTTTKMMLVLKGSQKLSHSSREMHSTQVSKAVSHKVSVDKENAGGLRHIMD